MKKLTLSQLRNEWLRFFENKGHLVMESKSLVPQDDDSLLWINSGVATLKKYFSGEKLPPATKMVNSQRCIRTNDIYNVGVTSRHHTFFEMLGIFSVGDYFRKEAIEMIFDFLTNNLLLDVNKLYVTVFQEDQQTYDLWISKGIKKNQIIKCDKKRNFWEIGQGPCGPCSEVFYDRGQKFDFDNCGEKLFLEDIENDRYIEIVNIVFSEFENDGNNRYKPLVKKNIDTGAGLERLACVLQEVNTNYDIDVFKKPRVVIEKFSNYKYDENLYFDRNKNKLKVLINKAFCVLIDHFKSCIFAIADGVIPANKDRGYVLKKLMRISFIYMDFLNIQMEQIHEIINCIIDTMNDYYWYLNDYKNKIYQTFLNEYKIHNLSLSKSIKQFIDLIESNNLSEKSLFSLVETHGFPIEIIKEFEMNNDLEIINLIITAISKKFKYNVSPIKKININFNIFNSLFDEHREISKTNKENNSLKKQNQNLINLNLDSSFDYNIHENKSKVIKIFDKDFNELETINDDEGYLVLDVTCFYATSGGQINDVGMINGYFIDDVFKSPNKQHIHHFKKGSFFVGQLVDIRIDLPRRQVLTCHHSLEHLLHSALKRVIDQSIKQEGALKTDEKVTFDFYYDKKLSIDQIKALENDIRNVIVQNKITKLSLVDLDEAKKMGALAYFENVYKTIKSKLRVVQLGDNSIEICGGTHVKNTAEIEDVLITKLESKGAGAWRIEAIATNKIIENFNLSIKKNVLDEINLILSKYQNMNFVNNDLENYLKVDFDNLHIIELRNYLDKLKNSFNIVKHKYEKENANKNILVFKEELKKHKEKVNIVALIDVDRKILMQTLTNLINENQESIYIVYNLIGDSYQYFLCGNEKIIRNDELKKASEKINKFLNGKGGGRINFIQGNFFEQNKDKILICLNEIQEDILNG